MNTGNDTDEARAERLQAAAEWLLTLQDVRLTHEQFLRWEAWIEQSPLNQQAFDEMERLSRRTVALNDELTDMPLPSRAETESDEYRGDMSVADWLQGESNGASEATYGYSKSRWHGMAKAAAVAGVAIVLGVVAVTEIPDGASKRPVSTYETTTSEHREITLADGSVIDIGARSSLSVNYTSDRRAVVLEAGEALFTVAKNPDRPFVVIAGSGTITAIGTAFNVRRDAAHVVVTVTEGKVEVEQRDESPGESAVLPTSDESPPEAGSATVSVGERVAYDATGMADVTATDPEMATSWLNGQLQFRAEPLKYVIKGVNRYSDKHVIIADKSVEDLVFTGTVFQDQADDWLKGLEAVFPVEVENVGRNTVLVRARPQSEIKAKNDFTVP